MQAATRILFPFRCEKRLVVQTVLSTVSETCESTAHRFHSLQLLFTTVMAL